MSTYQDFLDNKGEKKWQDRWAASGVYTTPADTRADNKMYVLPQLPYPSGSGLHVGHAEVYAACDIYARYQRMIGKDVLQVIGWDSFGLPAENYAIKTNVHPRVSTDNAIENFREQIRTLGISVDWSREVGAHNADYYKWTQWFFLLMYKRGLAYRKEQAVNWCDSCKTVLANDQVKEGRCERCDSPINQRQMEQWYLKVTEYAEQLLEGLDRIDWPEETKKRQRDWIGKSEGANFVMQVKGTGVVFEVYDSVPQTYTAQTFAVIAPEHTALPSLIAGTEHEASVLAFVEDIKKKKRDGNKFVVEQEVEGIFTGLYMDDPYGTGDIPLWVASFAIADYGSGVVGCSAHDERDFRFAKKYNIPLRPVMFPEDPVEAEKVRNLEYCYHHDPEAVLMSPKEFAGRKWGEAREDMLDFLEEKGLAKRAVQYKLRDWSVSRQRFWGAPIPMLVSKDERQYKADSLPSFVLDLHAWGSSPNVQYHPWLHQVLQTLGIPSEQPALPSSETPEFHAWFEAANRVLPDDSTLQNGVVTGRSLGCWTAMKIAEQKKLRKLVLVAPTSPIDAWYKQVEGKLDMDIAKAFVFDNVDLAAVKKNVDEIVIFLSITDPYIPVEETEVFFESYFPQARVIRVRDAGHFDVEHGYDTFTKLEEEICRAPYTYLQALRVTDLPVILPDDVDFKPTGQSPLTYSASFQNGVGEKYGDGWKREVDTLDTFMCSSWYYYRYLDPKNDEAFASPEALKKWMPVDFYLGGEEHVNGHLLYSRFFTKVLFDAGYIDFDEPFSKHRHQGLILGEDNRKMSKRWGNVINPTDIVKEFGADTCRMYEMFMGPLEAAKPWSTGGVKGVRRFLDKVWNLQERVSDTEPSVDMVALLHKTIKKVTEDTSTLQFNTAIAKMMELINVWGKEEKIAKHHFEMCILLLAPYAPHVAEEMWAALGHEDTVAGQSWPTYDETFLVEDTITLAVQVNGKLRATMDVSVDMSEEDIIAHALKEENVLKWLEGKAPKKVIYVSGKLVSIVV